MFCLLASPAIEHTRLHDATGIMKTPRVLIVSSPVDGHVPLVTRRLDALGIRWAEFNPEELGTKAVTAARLDDSEWTITASVDGRDAWFGDVSSLWFRRPRLPTGDSLETDALATSFVRGEWTSFLEAMYSVLDNVQWVSHPARLAAASSKTLQLSHAARLGLRVPRTLVTNDPDAAGAFIEDVGGRAVVKPSGPGWLEDTSGDIQYVLTNRVPAGFAELRDEIRLSPVTLQEEIAKNYEVRVNVVGQRVLAIKIESQRSPISELDWRRYDVQRTPYTPYTLPPDVEDACLRLVAVFGLQFGAIDLIRDTGGEYVFLEVNGNGQFGWAEELSGVPVSSAIAELLAGIAPPLRPAYPSPPGG